MCIRLGRGGVGIALLDVWFMNPAEPRRNCEWMRLGCYLSSCLSPPLPTWLSGWWNISRAKLPSVTDILCETAMESFTSPLKSRDNTMCIYNVPKNSPDLQDEHIFTFPSHFLQTRLRTVTCYTISKYSKVTSGSAWYNYKHNFWWLLLLCHNQFQFFLIY